MLCYNYDEVYSFGHCCKAKQVFMLSREGDELNIDNTTLKKPGKFFYSCFDTPPPVLDDRYCYLLECSFW